MSRKPPIAVRMPSASPRTFFTRRSPRRAWRSASSSWSALASRRRLDASCPSPAPLFTQRACGDDGGLRVADRGRARPAASRRRWGRRARGSTTASAASSRTCDLVEQRGVGDGRGDAVVAEELGRRAWRSPTADDACSTGSVSARASSAGVADEPDRAAGGHDERERGRGARGRPAWTHRGSPPAPARAEQGCGHPQLVRAWAHEGRRGGCQRQRRHGTAAAVRRRRHGDLGRRGRTASAPRHPAGALRRRVVGRVRRHRPGCGRHPDRSVRRGRRGGPARVGDPAEPRPPPAARRERRRAPAGCSTRPAEPASRTWSSPPAWVRTRRRPTTSRAVRAGRPTGCGRRRTASTRPPSSGCSTRSRPPTPTSRSPGCGPRSCSSAPRGSEISRYFLGPWVPKRAIDGYLVGAAVARRVCGCRWCMPTTSRRRSGRPSCVACAVRSTSPPPTCCAARTWPTSSRAGGWSRCRWRRPARSCGGGWHARAVPVGPGWLDMALAAPLLDTSRAERELDWRPTRSGIDTVRELVAGIASGAGTASPPLRPRPPLSLASSTHDRRPRRAARLRPRRRPGHRARVR